MPSQILDLPFTAEEMLRMGPHFPALNMVVDGLEEQERRLRRERLEVAESRVHAENKRRKLGLGDADPRKDVWDQEESRQKKISLYKLYLQNTPLGEIVDKIAKRFISGKWSVVPRPTLPGVKKQRVGKKRDLALLLDFLYNCNDQEDFDQLQYKFAQDALLFGESYLEVDSVNGIPVALYSLPTPYMDFVADKYNQVKNYTYAKPDNLTKMVPVSKEMIHRVWVPHLINPLRGFAVIEGMVNPLFSDQMMIKSNQTTFQNIGSSSQIVYEMGPSSSQSMARQLQSWLRENYTGIFNAGNERIMYGGTAAKVLNQKPLDSEWLDGREANRKEIKGRMHVPDDFTDETSERNFRFDVLDFLKSVWLEKFNYGIIQQRFGIDDWVLDLSFADYAADPYHERVKTVGEKRKEGQLEGSTAFDDIPLIALETHAQDQKQRPGLASRTPGGDNPVSRTKRLSRTPPGGGKDKKGASKPPAPPGGQL